MKDWKTVPWKVVLQGENDQGFPRVDDIHRVFAKTAIHEASGNKTAAAKKIGISRQTLRVWLKQIDNVENPPTGNVEP